MTERERAVALYSFLKEFSQLRAKTIRDISRYEQDGQVIWAADIPQEQGCHCIAWHRDSADTSSSDASDEVWLEIRKPRLTRPPEPPPSVQEWVRREQLNDSSLELPELWPTLPADSADDPQICLDDHPEARDVWDAYIVDHWWPWAELDRRERAVQEVYTDLFSMFQRQQRLGESFEVVFGLGLLSWAPDGQPVQRALGNSPGQRQFRYRTWNANCHTCGRGCPPLTRTGHVGSATSSRCTGTAFG